jgi:hypothetical protein
LTTFIESGFIIFIDFDLFLHEIELNQRNENIRLELREYVSLVSCRERIHWNLIVRLNHILIEEEDQVGEVVSNSNFHFHHSVIEI